MEQPKKKIGRHPLNGVRMSVAERQKKYLGNPENLIKHKARMEIWNDKRRVQVLAIQAI